MLTTDGFHPNGRVALVIGSGRDIRRDIRRDIPWVVTDMSTKSPEPACFWQVPRVAMSPAR
jgi:hypothetical protein